MSNTYKLYYLIKVTKMLLDAGIKLNKKEMV